MKPASPSKVIIVPQPPVKGQQVAPKDIETSESVNTAETAQDEKIEQEPKKQPKEEEKAD